MGSAVSLKSVEALQKEIEELETLKQLLQSEPATARSDLRRRLERVQLHRIVADDEVAGLSEASAFDLEWQFLTKLKDCGRFAAEKWMQRREVSAEHPKESPAMSLP